MATIPLLKTKLYIPMTRHVSKRRALLPRPRLLQALDASLDAKLTLLSAPAGFGKTTLLSAWAATTDLPIAWLSLEADDNDPIRFWRYVVAALQTLQPQIAPEIGAGVVAMLQATPPPPVEALMATLVNEVVTQAPDFVLVLDDYHEISAQPIHDALAFLLAHQPPQMHLMIATRADPPFPLARLRGRQQLVEIRADDLRFTVDETASFFNQVMELDLSEADVSILETRTEGWITGLQMAALSIRDRADVAGFMNAFRGTHRYILDYLLEEVLQREPAYLRSFMLRTSILDRFCGPLCDAVLGEDGTLSDEEVGLPEDGPRGQRFRSQVILEKLEQENLFIVPLDEARYWYRYHRLFADLLRARVELHEGEHLLDLHRRASAWYEQHGYLSEAVHHAMAARDTARVSAMIKAHGLALLLHGELVTLLSWFAALPEDEILADAQLCIYHAWALLLTGQIPAIEPRLQVAEQHLLAQPENPLHGHISAIRAYAATLRGEIPLAVHLARQALTQLDPDDLAIRSVVSFTLGGATLMSGDIKAASQALREASAMGRTGGNIHVAVPALNSLIELYMLQGRLLQAEMTAKDALALASDAAGRPIPLAGGVLSALADLYYERDDLDQALHYAQQSVEQSRRWGNVDALLGANLTLAKVLRAQGDLEGAASALHEAETLSQGAMVTAITRDQIQVARVGLWLAQENLLEAGRWADATWGADKQELAPPTFANVRLYFAVARVRLAQGDPGLAREILAPVLAMTQAEGLAALTLEGLILRILSMLAQGQVPEALDTLASALTLAQPEGYVRCFVDAGSEMGQLLWRVSRREKVGGYARRLCTAFGDMEAEGETAVQPAVQTPPTESPLIDPLSPRELEVLAIIAEGCSNREIAQQLYIAESTVKSHINAIFRKLDVKNRTQAVARANDLDILST